MRRQFIATASIVGTLVFGLATVSLATKNSPESASTGVVVTVSAIDPHDHMATLKTQDGATYQLPLGASWKVGDQIECDLMEPTLKPRLQNCRPWK
jgi:hypothetical protein